MIRIQLERLADDAKTLPDVLGNRFTIILPEPAPHVTGLQELLDWLKNNPDFLAMLIAAFLALLGGLAPPRQTR